MQYIYLIFLFLYSVVNIYINIIMSVVSFLSCFVRNLPKGSNGLLSSLFVCHRFVPKLHKLILPRKSQQDQIEQNQLIYYSVGLQHCLSFLFHQEISYTMYMQLLEPIMDSDWLIEISNIFFPEIMHIYLIEFICYMVELSTPILSVCGN